MSETEEIINEEITNNDNKINQSENINIPKRVFIVPYRNRIQQKFFFEKCN